MEVTNIDDRKVLFRQRLTKLFLNFQSAVIQIRLKRLKKLKRYLVRILVGVVFFILFGVVVSSKCNALDDSLLFLILKEMKRQQQYRAQFNAMIDYKQKVGEYASIGLSGIQPLIPKRYRRLHRLNYMLLSCINLFMLFIDFYRK